MATTNTTPKRLRTQLIVYTLGVNALAWAGYGLTQDLPPEENPGGMLFLVAPLLMAMLVRLFMKGGWKDFGLRPRFRDHGFSYVLSLLLYPAIIFLVISLGVQWKELTFNSSGGLMAAFLAMLPVMFFKNIFEEFGWRGFLAPKLMQYTPNRLKAHALTGLIWGSWHVPLILFTEYTTMPYGLFFPLFFIGCVLTSVVYGEIRYRTNSVWPAVLLHTMGNALANTLLGMSFGLQASEAAPSLSFVNGYSVLFGLGPEGIVGMGLMGIVGWWLWVRRQ